MKTSIVSLLAAAVLLAACFPDDESEETDGTPLRAVQTVAVTPGEATRTRSFPAVLEPPQITRLAFEVGGQLGPVDLQIGQRVMRGEKLMIVDPADFDLQLQQAEAALSEAEVGLANAREEASRQEQLFERGVASVAARDRAVTSREQAQARVTQAERGLDLVRASRTDTALTAPFDGVINTIEVQNFANIRAGEPVVTLYEDNGLQARILVSYGVVSALRMGDAVAIRPADDADAALSGTITEIAQRAPAVSSFPVVVALDEVPANLRSGMAVEVLLDLPLTDDAEGIAVPLSALITHLDAALDPAGDGARLAQVFVLDPEGGTLSLRDVTVGGMDTTRMVVTDGLAPGERVVTAGVSFLQPGQQVTLWRGGEAP